MAFWVYILRCSDKSLYIGNTDDLERRLDEHQSGASGYTRRRRPLRLVFADEFPTRDEAFFRERQIKSWTRAKKEALIAGNWTALSRLARGPDRARLKSTG